MKRSMIWLMLVTFLFAGTLTAQNQVRGTCGNVDPTHMLERVDQHKKWLENAPLMLRNSIPKYVPVTIIFVADDNGNGFALPEQALAQIASMNEQYADQEMVFYIDEFRYLESSSVYNSPNTSSSIFRMRGARDNNAMNIFVTRSAENGGGQPGTVLGYYSPSEDWIVIRKDEFNGFSATLAHEVGHFFGLPHPHSGWECSPYDEDVHGNPVSSIWSPCNAGLRVEFQDGSNCSNSGDRICDTPPDYNFGFGWSVGGDQCAPYTPEVRDPMGDVVNPMEENIMGYFINCDEYAFTTQQKNVIQADFFSSARSYLRTGVTPETAPVTNEVVYNYPINDEETPTFDNIELDWDNTPGANQYLVIVDRIGSFTLQPERFIVEESNLIVDELSEGKKYFWKVWPYNESQTGAGWAPTQSFFVGTASAVNTISSVEEVAIFPNPVSDQDLTISLRSSQTLNANIRLVDLSGKTVISVGEQVIQGGMQWQYSMNVTGLTPALYFLQIVSDKGIITEKVSVQ